GVMRLFAPKGCEAASLAYWARDTPVRALPIDHITATANQIHALAAINGQKLRVVFDTGAARTLLSMSAARRLGLSATGPGVTPMGSVAGVGARIVPVYLVPVGRVS